MVRNGMESVVIVGGGQIGLAMAAVFADSGFRVTVVETSDQVRSAAKGRLEEYVGEMRNAGLAQGGLDGALENVHLLAELPSSSKNPALAIEAGPESASAKRAIFEALRDWGGPDMVIASTSSAIPVSRVVLRPKDRTHCVVAHCANPPTLIRVIEIVPAAETLGRAADIAGELLERAGFKLVRLRREVEGFAFNRLQSALLREAYRLVEDGVVDVEGIDRLVSEGLGPRWALAGPFETADLNTPGGIAVHAERLGPAYKRIGEEIGERRAGWSPELVAEVERQRRAAVCETDLVRRARWRRVQLSRILSAKRAAEDAWQSLQRDK